MCSWVLVSICFKPRAAAAKYYAPSPDFPLTDYDVDFRKALEIVRDRCECAGRTQCPTEVDYGATSSGLDLVSRVRISV